MSVLSDFRLDDKVVFIAGEANGLTPVMAEGLAEAGAKVFIIAPSQATVEGSMWAVASKQGQALGMMSDPNNPSAVEDGLEMVKEIWGRVDVLINNCRFPLSKPFEVLSVEEWTGVMDQNATCAFNLSQILGREMLSNGKGRIIHILSGLAERGLGNAAAFCASQGAILQLSRALALEWARKNIRVNVLGVGWFPPVTASSSQQEGDVLDKYIPLKRREQPRDIVPLVVYLSSDASQYVTGQPIYVDGGLMARP